MITLNMLAEEIKHLDPIPVAHARLAQVVVNPSSSLQEIVKVIEFDPVLTANTLRLVNSAYYSRGGRVYAVQVAVQQLGAGRILQMVVGRAIRDRLMAPCKAYDLDECELWKHSVASALCADLLPGFVRVPIHPAAFTAALLHDIGKLVISRHLDAELVEDIRTMVKVRKMTYIQAERSMLGFDHAQVGGVIAHRWGFPQVLVDCIRYHHEPRDTYEELSAMDAVHISNAVAKTIGVGMGIEEMNMSASTESVKRLGLTPTSLESLCAATAQELPAVIELYDGDERGVQHSYR